MPTWMVKLGVNVGSALILGMIASLVTCLNWLFVLQSQNADHARDISALQVKQRDHDTALVSQDMRFDEINAHLSTIDGRLSVISSKMP